MGEVGRGLSLILDRAGKQYLVRREGCHLSVFVCLPCMSRCFCLAVSPFSPGLLSVEAGFSFFGTFLFVLIFVFRLWTSPEPCGQDILESVQTKPNKNRNFLQEVLSLCQSLCSLVPS